VGSSDICVPTSIKSCVWNKLQVVFIVYSYNTLRQNLCSIEKSIISKWRTMTYALSIEFYEYTHLTSPWKMKKIYLPKIYEMIYLKHTERPFYIDLDFSMEQRFCPTVLYEYTIKTTCSLLSRSLYLRFLRGVFWPLCVWLTDNVHLTSSLRNLLKKNQMLGYTLRQFCFVCCF
jgi:hypothetical protein